jgi:uncharacterized protein
MQKGDFSGRKWFPGTSGGPFDSLLHATDRIERIPWPLFGLLLLALAAVPGRGSWTLTAILFGFFMADWVLVACLPAAGKSFGPSKPPALLLAVLRIPFAYLPMPWFLLVQALGSALAFYAFWIEPQRLTITRARLTASTRAPAPPLRVLHIADLHLERITDRERALQRLIREERPDLILFSGDFLSLSCVLDPAAWADVRALLTDWQAPLGVFAVAGSPPVDPPQVLPHLLEGMTHIRCLHGEKATVSHHGIGVDILGLDCSHKPFVDAPKLTALAAGRPARNFTILLYHSPDLAPEAAGMGIDLMLSGHTHGGQVRLPGLGAVYAASLYGKRFEAGRYALGEMTLYVSRGLGMEGKGAPRVRVLCPPEAILWEISFPGS